MGHNLEEFTQYIYDITSKLDLLKIDFIEDEFDEATATPEERANFKNDLRRRLEIVANAEKLSSISPPELNDFQTAFAIGGSLMWLFGAAVPRIYGNLHGLTQNPGPNDIISFGDGKPGSWKVGYDPATGQLFNVRERVWSNKILKATNYKYAIKNGKDLQNQVSNNQN